MTRDMEKFRVKEWEFSTQKLAKEFTRKYFGDDADNWWVGDDISGVYHVNGYFFDVSRMLQALKLNATLDQLIDYYDLEVEAFDNKKTLASFQNYVKYGMIYV